MDFSSKAAILPAPAQAERLYTEVSLPMSSIQDRGIVAMANESSPNSNGSQFFFTLVKCDWLCKKHTIFGKVTGDSIFNLLRLGEVFTGKDDRPLDPAPELLSVEILWNPFEDNVPRVSAKTSHVPVAEAKDPKKKIKCSHDSKEVLSVREALGSKKEAAQKYKSLSVSDPVGHSDDDDNDDEDDTKFDAKIRNQVRNRRKETGDIPPKSAQEKKGSSVKGPEESIKRSDVASREDEKPKMEKLSFKRKGIGSEAKAERIKNGYADLQLYNGSERARQLHKLKKRRLQGNEEDAVFCRKKKNI